ncbi:MAG: AtpZ/AtpI family protein [Anaerolineae bacterium]|nr:AtpZ/AtpI family protein [Anaerolineae bacterium]
MTNNSNSPYAALGLALQAGCLTVLFIIGALVVGLWIDQQFGTRRIAPLVCVVVSAPISLLIVLWLTQRLVARIIPLSGKPTAGVTPSKPSADPEDDQP